MTLRCRLGLHSWRRKVRTLSTWPHYRRVILECGRCGKHERRKAVQSRHDHPRH